MADAEEEKVEDRGRGEGQEGERGAKKEGERHAGIKERQGG